MLEKFQFKNPLIKRAILLCGLSLATLGSQAQITINNSASLAALSMGYNGYLPPAQLRYVGSGTVTGWAVSASAPLLAPTSTGGTYGYNLPFPTATTTVNASSYTSYGDATVNAFNSGGLVASKFITIYPRDVEVPNSISYPSGNISGTKTLTATGNRWVNSASYYGWAISDYNAPNYTITGSGTTATITPQTWAPFDEFLTAYCYFVPYGAPFGSSEGYLPYGKTTTGAIGREVWVSYFSNISCPSSAPIINVDVDDSPNAGTYTAGGPSMATGAQSWRLKHFSRKWFKNDVEIPGKTAKALITTGVGSYKCVVRQYSQVASGGGYIWDSTYMEKTSNTIEIVNPTATSSLNANFTINGATVNSTTPLLIYSCKPILFNSTSGPIGAAYKIDITQGVTPMWTSGFVNGTLQTAFDLRSVYGFSPGNVYDISYTLYNECMVAGATKIGKINFQDATASVNFDMKQNGVSGPVYTSYAIPFLAQPLTTAPTIYHPGWAPALSLGITGVNIPSSTGVVSSNILVEEVSPSDGTRIAIISSDDYPGAPSGVTYEFNSNPSSLGYFIDNYATIKNSKEYKVTVTANTPGCGIVSKFSYFKIIDGGPMGKYWKGQSKNGAGLLNTGNDKVALTISPNPSNGIFTIEFDRKMDNATVIVLSVDGREIINKQTSEMNTSIDISSAQAGTYFIKVINGSNTVIQKIAKL